MLIESGIVSKVKLLSLKHNTPSSFSVVFDTITENPRNLDVCVFLVPTNKSQNIQSLFAQLIMLLY